MQVLVGKLHELQRERARKLQNGRAPDGVSAAGASKALGWLGKLRKQRP